MKKLFLFLFILYSSTAQATTNLFVDTASTVGSQNCTTATPGSTGTAACANLAQAIDLLPATLLTDYKITLYDTTGLADTVTINQAHWDFTTSATNFLWIYVDPAYRHRGYYDATKYRIEVTDNHAIYNSTASHVRIEGLQVQITVTTSIGNDYNGIRLTTANNTSANIDHRTISCLANFIVAPGATDNGYGFQDSDPITFTGNNVRINDVAIGGNTGFATDSSVFAASHVANYNVTAYGNEFPFQGDSIIINSIGAGATGVGGVFLGTFTGNNNASDQAGTPGTSSRSSQTFSFYNPIKSDVRLKTTDAGARTFGAVSPTLLIGGTYTDDFIGNVRGGVWDIGASEATTSTVALTGTSTSSITEADIVAGGKTAILTATNDSFLSNTGAIGYVGGQVGGFAGTVSNTDITFSLTNGVNSGSGLPSAGDLVVITFCTGSTADRTLNISTVAGTVYTLIGSELYADGTLFDTNMRVAYRFMPGTPETDFRFVGGTGNAADAGSYSVHVYRNVDTTTTLDVAATTATGTGSRLVNPPSITTSTANSWIQVTGCGAAATGGTYTTSGLNDFRTNTRVGTNDSILGTGNRIQASAGAYDHAAYTGGGTDTANDSWASVVFALRPADASAFTNIRSTIVTGFNSNQAEAAGWNIKRGSIIPVGNIVRTSDNILTITFAAVASYDITLLETVTDTLAGLVSTLTPNASPTFTISATGGASTCQSKFSLLGISSCNNKPLIFKLK